MERNNMCEKCNPSHVYKGGNVGNSSGLQSNQDFPLSELMDELRQYDSQLDLLALLLNELEEKGANILRDELLEPSENNPVPHRNTAAGRRLQSSNQTFMNFNQRLKGIINRLEA
jgi:hypothetical protein